MSGAADDALSALRLGLLTQGYEPIPVVGPDAPGQSPGKRPSLKEWQTVPIEPDTVRGWRQGYQRDCTNTGIRTGLLLGVDIDVLAEALSEELQDLALKIFGYTPLRRVGRAPKSLFCYRVAEPIAKAETQEFILPDGTKAQVEILAKGQQFVAYGIHPDTRAEYEWPISGPDVVPFYDLPQIGSAAVKAFLASAEVLIREAGGRPLKEIEAEQRAAREPPRPERPRGTIGGAFEQGGDFFRNVNGKALADTDRWVKNLFPRAYWQPNATTPPGAWRVHSADLGRGLEEDISIHPTEGCQDFGTREGMTPIDLIMQHGGAPDAKAAAFALCDWLGFAPEDLGWRAERRREEAARHDRFQEPPRGEYTESRQERQKKPRGPAKPLVLIDPTKWEGIPPERVWVVPHWVPSGVVTGLYGDGAAGKSLSAMQLLTSVALALPWFGVDVNPGKALGIFCEDDDNELWRRQRSIMRSLDMPMASLENLRLLSRFGAESNALITFDGSDVGVTTPFYDEVDATCAEVKPSILVLDTIADLFPGNENNRSQVRQFVQSTLGSLARKHQCAVVALGHPSVTGINTGTGASGSTAWNNTFRSRIFLTREEGDDADPNGRLLSRKKSNYGPRDAEIKLQWHEGAFRVQDPGPAFRASDVSWSQIREIYDELERAWKAGDPWSPFAQTKTTGRYFPAWTRRLGISEVRIKALLSDWQTNGYLAYEEVNAKTKKNGLRVVKRLHPDAGG